MRRLAVAAVLLGAGGLARASSTPMVHAPEGWRADAEQAAEVGKSVATSHPFTDPAATVATEVYAPPSGRISLVVVRASSRAAQLDRPAAAKGAIDDLHAITDRARLSGAKPVEDAWQPSVLPAEVVIGASLSWHDPDGGTREDAAIVLAQDTTMLVSVTGECVAASDTAPALVTACKAALATLDTGIPQAARVAIPAPAAAPAGSAAAPGSAADAPLPTAPSHPGAPLAHLDDGSRISLPPMVIPQDGAPADRRPVYFGAGIVILALAFYWNRRSRERFEPEDQGKHDDSER